LFVIEVITTEVSFINNESPSVLIHDIAGFTVMLLPFHFSFYLATGYNIGHTANEKCLATSMPAISPLHSPNSPANALSAPAPRPPKLKFAKTPCF
jgi:hypothetical protein